MTLFGGVIPVTGLTFFMLCVFAILVVGYGLGRITIKGVSLGDAGVFIIALLFGALFYGPLQEQLMLGDVSYAEKGLEVIETLGLVLFVTAVGFIAGPKFFGNMKKNFKSYVLLGLVIIIAGGLAAVGCICIGRNIGFGGTIENSKDFTGMIAGILSGALTSTPAFSASKEAARAISDNCANYVSVGYGIAYIFGVLGVVLFVQLMPKFMKANMDEERAKIVQVSDKLDQSGAGKKLFLIDDHGIAPFAFAAILGLVLGKIKIPLTGNGLSGTCFSLTTTGGCLLAALVLGHFKKIGRVSIMPSTSTLKLFRELGLVFFLLGAGVPAGAEFVENFDAMYFVYGVVITIFPMIIGFLFAKYVLKLPLLNNLGSITGGMTSTPALGTLISSAKTEDVAAAYAATYPIALIAVVLVSQLLFVFF